MEEKTDLRIRKTYKALCDAFVTILEKKRFDDLTVNELCDEATIRRATFYKHFADKHDFFSFFIRQKQDQFISQAKEETPPNGIYAYTLYLTQRSILYFKEHGSLIQNILKSDIHKVILLSILPTCFRIWHCRGICRRHCSCFGECHIC